jgi:hypothetical protein
MLSKFTDPAQMFGGIDMFVGLLANSDTGALWC